MLKYHSEPNQGLQGLGVTAPLAAMHYANTNFGLIGAAYDSQVEYRKQTVADVGDRPSLATIDLVNSESGFVNNSVQDVLAKRKSAEEYVASCLVASRFLPMLACALLRTNGRPGRRPYPSGGALYSIEPVFFVRNVHSLDAGLYVVDNSRMHLKLLQRDSGGLIETVFGTCLYPDHIQNAAAVCFLIANFSKSAAKYGERSYRLALLEAGHISQNLLLAATANDIGCRPVCGFEEVEVNNLLGLNGFDHGVVEGITFGVIADSQEYVSDGR
ncbi:SagB-type dehydrogenase domain-containing protein [Brevibacterium aurantiacum]|uniref:SagB-type dehydrogenase domain-containing protein n=1 Tax=Brevibacterium aurantiacum TaxID=273384 RepID=A0A2H1K7R4_BREAU|nr:SagB/ThcOx family dehydrogenase [Brevibacterium aurantiacum]SMX95669.1 SagB-type dehydrogenase domain-containing protein [Brevibacterium aurantiacum]